MHNVIAVARKCSNIRNMAGKHQWIEDRLRELKGKNKKGLADALGLQPPRISDLIKGMRELQGREIRRAADYLEMPWETLMALAFPEENNPSRQSGQTNHKSPELDERLYIRGVVTAGDWVDADEMDWPRDDWRYFDSPIDSRFPKGERFGLLVDGPSMNQFYHPGSIIICINPIHAGYDIADGDHVVVRTRRDDGLVEMSVKELVQQDGEWWLWPRSDHPDHQQPIRAGDIHNGEEDSDILVMGVVVGTQALRHLKGNFRNP